MVTLLECPLNEVSASEIEVLKSRFPGASLRIEGNDFYAKNGMDEGKFWAIIALFDWKTRAGAAVLAPAVKALSQFSEAEIHAFHEILNQKLFALDGQRFAENLGSNQFAAGSGKHFSVDSFLYSRCCVVANGRVFYEKVLADPSKMPKEFGFESLLYLPNEAWKMKTGRDDYQYFPEIWCETFSNPVGWPGITPLKDRLNSL